MDGTSSSLPSEVDVVPQTPQLIALYTVIRDRETSRADFVFHADRIIRLLLEHALNYVPLVPRRVTTPVGAVYDGLAYGEKICGVSVVRAGEAFEHGLRQIARSVRIGKILMQRDERTAEPRMYWAKLPNDIASRWVLLMDPMVATGRSVSMAVAALLRAGVPQTRVLVVSMFACREGVEALLRAYPHVRLVTGAVDAGLTPDKYITPGVGDFGDLYFGTMRRGEEEGCGGREDSLVTDEGSRMEGSIREPGAAPR
ncbi:hypothetical protein CDCA_CDCA08G2326 [Cyanidium caldarium]|uniref:uracil phosphoribosyltransferase n=1 Tax=Cyanidium caldarium TaxID=2771 RepID=A0AAV9IVV9_CYACA|nr:hypothetical protein CDCA_CDCA08G2326 [Cyanidium caldarium]